MKIFIIGSKGIPAKSGGIERHVEELACGLVQEGHDVFVYTRKHYTKYSQKKYKGVNLIYLPSINTKHLDAISHTFLATLNVLRQSADIIHYHGIGPSSLSWIPRIFKPQSKIISTYHSADYKHKKWNWFAKQYLKISEKIACKIPTATIAVSKSQYKYIKKYYNTSPTYIPNGINTPKKDTRTNILKKYKLKPKKYLLTVNRLIRHKGIHYLIDAYNKLETNKKLVIVGDAMFSNNYVDELKKQAKNNHNIIFTGQLSAKDLRQIYTHASIYIHPSEYEGLSISLLEAMSFGIPTIASNIAPNKELITNNCGISFRSKNISDLYEKMKELLKNNTRQKIISQNAQTMINSTYSWDKIIKKTIKLYNYLLTPSKNYKRNKSLSRGKI